MAVSVSTTSPSKLMRPFWWLSFTLLLTCMLFTLTIIPFFAYGIHMQPINRIFDGAFDPKFYPLYSGAIGEPLHFVVLLFILFAPVYGAVTSILLCWWLTRNRITLNSVQRIVSLVALTAAGSLILFCLTPLGRAFYMWMGD